MSSVISDCRCGGKGIMHTDGRNNYYIACTKCFMRTANLRDRFRATVCWNNCMRNTDKNHIAESGKKDMDITTALIILNNLNTTERIDVDREELIEAVKVVSAAAKKQLSVPLTIKHGMATDSSGNEIPVKQPCCPICGEAILNARQRRIKFCPECGQAIQIERETEERK